MSTIIGLVSTFRLPLHFLIPFGLQPVSQPLQRPIRLSFSFLLDFNLPSLCFNVQSATTFLFFYIYTNPSLKKFNFTPLLPTIFPSSPHHKKLPQGQALREHLRNIQTIKLYINYL